MKNNYSDYYYQTNKEYVDVEYKEVEPKKAVAAKNGLSKPITWLLVLGLSVGVAFGSGSAVTRLASNASQTTTTTQAASVTATSTSASKSDISVTDVSDVVSEVMPSIVAITCVSEEEYMMMFGRSQTYESESAGSGIIIGEDDDYLYIVTNNHVVEGADAITVQFNNDDTAECEVQGTDSDNDLAVVKIALSEISEDTLSEIKVATIGDSDSLEVGESAIAIGNALGYGQSVTTGVISALNREVVMEDEETGEQSSAYLIQTDAAINPGNSGGALINSAGELIGINSSKYSDTDVEGMGFAIPMATALPIIQDLIENGTVAEEESEDVNSATDRYNSDYYGGSYYDERSMEPGNAQGGAQGGMF